MVQQRGALVKREEEEKTRQRQREKRQRDAHILTEKQPKLEK